MGDEEDPREENRKKKYRTRQTARRVNTERPWVEGNELVWGVARKHKRRFIVGAEG